MHCFLVLYFGMNNGGIFKFSGFQINIINNNSNKNNDKYNKQNLLYVKISPSDLGEGNLSANFVGFFFLICLFFFFKGNQFIKVLGELVKKTLISTTTLVSLCMFSILVSLLCLVSHPFMYRLVLICKMFILSHFKYISR